MIHADAIRTADSVLNIGGGKDVQVLFSSGQPPIPNDCSLLQVQALIESKKNEEAQLFYIPLGTGNFNETNSQKTRVSAGNPITIKFIISSTSGFEDRFRLDPVNGPGPVKMSKLELQCLSLR